MWVWLVLFCARQGQPLVKASPFFLIISAHYLIIRINTQHQKIWPEGELCHFHNIYILVFYCVGNMTLAKLMKILAFNFFGVGYYFGAGHQYISKEF